MNNPHAPFQRCTRAGQLGHSGTAQSSAERYCSHLWRPVSRGRTAEGAAGAEGPSPALWLGISTSASRGSISHGTWRYWSRCPTPRCFTRCTSLVEIFFRPSGRGLGGRSQINTIWKNMTEGDDRSERLDCWSQPRGEGKRNSLSSPAAPGLKLSSRGCGIPPMRPSVAEVFGAGESPRSPSPTPSCAGRHGRAIVLAEASAMGAGKEVAF